VINLISKVPGLPDAPATNSDRYQWGGRYFVNGPRLMEFLTEMKQRVLSKYDILTVGETALVTTGDAIMIANEEFGALTMVFQFDHMGLDSGSGEDSRRSVRQWKLLELKAVMSRWQKHLEGRAWNSNYLANHDQPRAVSRFGNDRQYRVESAKLLATFTHMLQGTPYIYQGEEIGMTNVAFESIDDYRDVETMNIYKEVVGEKGGDPQATLKVIHAKSRDNARTPMQWNVNEQAGFTSGTPWIKVNPNYTKINVAQALDDPNSIFYYYQKLIRLRKENPVIVYGNYNLILGDHEQIYAFTRTLDADRLLVILNFSTDTPVFNLSEEVAFSNAQLLIGNYDIDAPQEMHQIILRPYEARVYRLG
jgi:oligo-1,6-glucosidase